VQSAPAFGSDDGEVALLQAKAKANKQQVHTKRAQLMQSSSLQSRLLGNGMSTVPRAKMGFARRPPPPSYAESLMADSGGQRTHMAAAVAAQASQQSGRMMTAAESMRSMESTMPISAALFV
jgi:hypothetical protein